MIRIFNSAQVSRADILYRGRSGSTQAVEQAVADILADVQENGDAAVLRYAEKFDGVKLDALRVRQTSRRFTSGSFGKILSSTIRRALCWGRR